MLTHTNIERSNSQNESKAPFTFESTMLVNGMRVPQGGFLSIKVYVDSDYTLPVHIHCIRQDGTVVFADARGADVALWKTKAKTDEGAEYVTDFLYTDYGVIAGSIACTIQTLEIFRGAIAQRTSDYYLAAGSFILIPQCHIAMMKGSAKAIKISDTYFTSDVTLHGFTPSVIPEGEEDKMKLPVVDWRGAAADIVNKLDTVLDRQQKNGICSIVVNGTTTACDGKRLIIKSKMTPEYASNLRVVRDGNQIILRGVKDA